jgi:hypothetical protein
MPSYASTTGRTGLLSALLAAFAVALGATAVARAAAPGGFTAPDDPGVPALIAGLRGCLNSLPAADRQVLTLRAGLGGRPAQLTAQVAATLHESGAAATAAEVLGIRRLEAARRRGACQVQAAASTPARKPAAPAKTSAATTAPASSSSSSDSTTGLLEVIVPVLLVLAFIAGISLEVNRRPHR